MWGKCRSSIEMLKKPVYVFKQLPSNDGSYSFGIELKLETVNCVDGEHKWHLYASALMQFRVRIHFRCYRNSSLNNASWRKACKSSPRDIIDGVHSKPSCIFHVEMRINGFYRPRNYNISDRYVCFGGNFPVLFIFFTICISYRTFKLEFTRFPRFCLRIVFDGVFPKIYKKREVKRTWYIVFKRDTISNMCNIKCM